MNTPGINRRQTKRSITLSASRFSPHLGQPRAFASSTLLPFSPFSVRDEVLRAEAYAQAKQYPEARAVVDELRRLLAFADPDFPLLDQVRRVEQHLP